MVTNALAWVSLKEKVRQRLRAGRWFMLECDPKRQQ